MSARPRSHPSGAPPEAAIIGQDPAATAMRPATVHDRLRAAGLSSERIRQHLDAKRIRVEGHIAADLDHPAPTGTRIVILSR